MREKRREDFRWAIEELMVDRKLPEGSEPMVEHLRRLHGFSKDDARALIADVVHEEEERIEGSEEVLAQVGTCPHCGKKVGGEKD